MKLDILYLAIGAILGTLLRYRITGEHLFFNSVPVSVLIVNLTGSFILGLSMTAITRFGLDPRYTLFIGIGFCGALTTMSSFAFETMGLIDLGAILLAALDIFLNVGGSILAVFAGRAVLLLLIGAR